MQKKRDRLEIIYNILKIIHDNKNSIRPTPLLRFSNVSSQSFSEYYNELINKGFIRETTDNNDKKYVSLSDKGFIYLEKYKYILEFIDEFEL
jgi:predicted transcriptional regulator